MLKALKSITTGTIISIYADATNTEKFSAGFYLGNDGTDVLIAHITPYGKYDGYLTKRIDNIFLIETSNQYCHKLDRLFCLQNQEYECVFNGTSVICDLILWAQKKHKIISIELVDSGYSDIQGYVQFIEDDLVTISCIDDFGKNNGSACVELHNISSVVCDSEKEYSLDALANDL